MLDGFDIRTQGKLARNLLGYVPQETNFYDMSLDATIGFYARLRQIDLTRIPPLISRLGLEGHLNKRVSALSEA
jgi:ABC-2 type transport system ATP-binding protein/nitrous oxidase accessory protein